MTIVVRVVPGFYDEASAYGSFITFLKLTTEQMRMGHRVIVVSQADRDYKELVEGVPVARIATGKHLPFLQLQFRLWQMLRSSNQRSSDVVIHSHGRAALGLSFLLKKLRHVVHLHDMPYQAFSHYREVTTSTASNTLYNIRVFFLYRLALRSADAVITYSKELAHFATKYYAVPSAKVFVIYNGVDGDFFSPRAKETGYDLNRYGLGSGKNVVLYVGRIGSIKGIYQLVLAMRLVVEEVGNARLLVIGSASAQEEQKFTALLRAAGLERFTIRISHVPHSLMPIIYARASVNVSTQLAGFPKTILESLACGTPVIASANIDTEEIVGRNGCGVLVSPTDITGIARAILDLLHSPELSREMGRRGSELVRSRFTWRHAAEMIDQVYSAVLAS